MLDRCGWVLVLGQNVLGCVLNLIAVHLERLRQEHVACVHCSLPVTSSFDSLVVGFRGLHVRARKSTSRDPLRMGTTCVPAAHGVARQLRGGLHNGTTPPTANTASAHEKTWQHRSNSQRAHNDVGIQRGSTCYAEEARVCAKMKPWYCKSTIYKRSINYIEKVAFTVHLKSTKIAICVSVRKRILVNC